MGVKAQLKRWQKAGLIDQNLAGKILAYEIARSGGLFGKGMLALGALAIALGLAAITASNWDALTTAMKFAGVIAINLAFAGGVYHALRKHWNTAREVLLFLQAAAVLAFIALIGQVYQTGAPLWQALTLWLTLVSPFLFMLARARFTAVVWTVMLLVTLGAAAESAYLILSPLYFFAAFYALVPLVMIGVGEWPRLRAAWFSWARVLAGTGYALAAVAVSASLIGWRLDTTVFTDENFLIVQRNALIAALAMGAFVGTLWLARRLKSLPNRTAPFLAASVVLGSLPWIIPHGSLPVLGAALFMAYWALIGWTGLQLGKRDILNVSIVIIALRLVAVYIEVFGSLLSTGIGLIASGLLMIALVVATRKIIRKLGHVV